MESDVVEEYKSSLGDLNCNSKPMINVLTIIAEENIKYAQEVVQVIENHISNAAANVKLPALYLIDSIIKNVGRDYLNLFSQRIVSIFSSVFEKVDEKTRYLLFKLRQTWTGVFANSILYGIDNAVNQMDPAWPITSQPPISKGSKTPTIHINPRFLAASGKMPEDSISVRETEAKRRAHQEVLKQLLKTKQEKQKAFATKAKEPEKKEKNNTCTRPIVVHPPKSNEVAPVERREVLGLDPRIVQRDPRLRRNAVSTGVHKVPDEDKSSRNSSPAIQNQGSVQTHSTLPSVVLVPCSSSSQTAEVDIVVSRNDRKAENSSDSSKKKPDKSVSVEAKASSEQTKSEDSKPNSVKRFPSPQKLGNELSHQFDHDKIQRGQDSHTSHKVRTDASPGKSKSVSGKEKHSNSDSKQPAESKSSTTEKSKTDVKDSHVEGVKHSGRPSRGSPQPSVEAEKEHEAHVSSSRSRGAKASEGRKSSPNRRSRSPLGIADKKKSSSTSNKTASSSARHIATEKSTDNMEVDSVEEPVTTKAAPDALHGVDTDLRISALPCVSPEKTTEVSKKDSSFPDVEDEEPPTKKPKNENQDQNSDDVSWFGSQDQDYRCKEIPNKINDHQGWAQYKAVHPDEFKSPLRPARENMENICPGNENFRDDHGELQSKHGPSQQRVYGGGPRNFGSECDTLGRPHLNRKRNYDSRFRGRYGKRYNLQRYGNFYGDKDYDLSSMLSNPNSIMRQAQEKYQEGLINEECLREICGGLQKVADSARRLGIRMPDFNMSSTKNTFRERSEFPDSQMRCQNKRRGSSAPRHLPRRGRGRKRMPPVVRSFGLDNTNRDIYFVDDKAIVEMNGTPKLVVLKGPPTQVYIEGMEPITVKFDGKPVEFEVDGKEHVMKFGVPTRELYIDDYPYEGKFGGPPFVVDIDDKSYSVRLGTPAPSVVFLDELEHDLYEKFLSIHRSERSNARASPILDTEMCEKGIVSDFPMKAEDTDFRSGEDERTASGSISSDVDMRTAGKIKKEPLDCEHFNESEYVEVGTNDPIADMKDIDWRHALSHDSANSSPNVTEDSKYLPPQSRTDSYTSSDYMSHPSLPRNQALCSEEEQKLGSESNDSTPQMRPSVWNGQLSHGTLEDRSQSSSEQHDWEDSQGVGPWQKENSQVCPPVSLQPQVRAMPHMPNMPNWRGGRFTPPYAPNEPVDRVIPPPHAPQQPNWRQPLQTINEGNPNMPGWEWRQRGYQSDVPQMRVHPSDQGHPYGMQRNESKPQNNIFENYRTPYEQLPPPPLPPRGPLLLMGNQRRPEMPGSLLRPTVPTSDLRNSRPQVPHQRQWMPRNALENMTSSVREHSMLKFPPPVPVVSNMPPHSQLRTPLPPPPLPPNLPNIPVSLQGQIPYNMPRVQSTAVSEISGSESATSQAYGRSFPVQETSVKCEVTYPSSSQGNVQTDNTGPQQSTQQVGQPITSQGSTVDTLLQVTGPPSTSQEASSSSTAPPSVLDISALMERLIAAGIITSKPSQAEKMDVVEQDVKSENDNTSKEREEPTPPIEFTSESLKGRYPGVISALFQGTQCASCGMRFKDTHGERYKRHLDWHFRVNRREKDGAKKAFSRKWYYDVEDWIQFEEFEDFEERARSFFELQADEEQLQAPAVVEVPTVPAARGNETEVCVVCGEAFQLLWLEEEEEWHLKDAVREDEQPYHPLCFEDFKKALEVPDTPVDETPPADATIAEKEKEETDEGIGEDAISTDNIKTENVDAEEEKENEVPEKQESADGASTVEEVEEDKVKEEEEEVIEKDDDEPLEGKPGEEEIIGVITESDMEAEENEPLKETKMVVLQSGGIIMKVRAESIQHPASPAPATPDKDADPNEESEEEFRPPTPDPRFKVLPPVMKGTELSGLCTIM